MSVYNKEEGGLKKTRIKKISQKRYLSKKYYYTHMRCPQCNGTKNHKFEHHKHIPVKPEEYVDYGKCECICGWFGIVHDRLPFENKNNES